MRRRKIYAIGVEDAPGEVRLMNRADWQRTLRGDHCVALTRDPREAMTFRTETAAWLAFSEFNLGSRGYSCIALSFPPRAH